jgi:hypothetical protein
MGHPVVVVISSDMCHPPKVFILLCLTRSCSFSATASEGILHEFPPTLSIAVGVG